MKTYFRNKTSGILLITMMIAGLTMWSCGGGQNRAAKQQLEEAKQQTVQNINQIKNDIDQRIDYVEEELEEASGETEENLKEARKELKKQSAALDEELANVERATVDTWNDVVARAGESLSQARDKTNEISKNVREMLDELEE